jgi:hypothetical protein
MSKNNKQIQKGGGGLIENFIIRIMNTNPLIVLIMNILLIMIQYFIFKYLFTISQYKIILYLFIGLIIVSFFSILFILWCILKNNNIFNQNDSIDPTHISRIGSFIILTCTGILQFVGTILMVTVLNNRPPPDDSFHLTNTNATNLFNYEIYYIITYFCSICLAVIIVTPLSINPKTKEKIFYYITLFLMTIALIYVCAYSFYSSYAIYYNVIIRKNQLYQGSPNTTVKSLQNATTKPNTGGSLPIIPKKPAKPAKPAKPFCPVPETPIEESDEQCYS